MFPSMHSLSLSMIPPPHDTEHMLSAAHWLQPSHFLLLHARLSETEPTPHTEVSSFSAMFKHSLVLVWNPSPHDAEQSPKSDHKLHRGQALLLQFSMSEVLPWQLGSPGIPPTHDLDLILVADPHVALHALHIPHSLHLSQACSLQFWYSTLGPTHRGFPISSLWEHSLVLIWVPPPHLSLHSPKEDHWSQYGQSPTTHSSVSSSGLAQDSLRQALDLE